MPGHRHKMVLCSDAEYPGNQCLVQCPSTRSWVLEKTCVHISEHTHRARAPSVNTALAHKKTFCAQCQLLQINIH